MGYKYYLRFGKRPTIAKGVYPAMDLLFQWVRKDMVNGKLTLYQIRDMNFAFRVHKDKSDTGAICHTELELALVDFERPEDIKYVVSLTYCDKEHQTPASAGCKLDYVDLFGKQADATILAINYFYNRAREAHTPSNVFSMPLQMGKIVGVLHTYCDALIRYAKQIDKSLKEHKPKAPAMVLAVRNSHLFDREDDINFGDKIIYQFAKYLTTLQITYGKDGNLFNVRLASDDANSVEQQKFYLKVAEFLRACKGGDHK